MKSIYLLLPIFILSFVTVAKAEQEWRFDANQSFKCDSIQFIDAAHVHRVMGDSFYLKYKENTEANKGVYQNYYNYAKCILDKKIVFSDQKEQGLILSNAQDVMLKIGCYQHNLKEAKKYYIALKERFPQLIHVGSDYFERTMRRICNPLYILNDKEEFVSIKK